MEMNFQEEDHPNDQFDRLPDALVRLIFNQIIDAKSLCLCKSVCKRFSSIIPEINTISLKIPRKNSNPIGDNKKEELIDQNSKSKGGLSRNFLKSLINKVITKPVQFILQIIIPNSFSKHSRDDNDSDSYYSPDEVLKSFNEVQFLQIELPGHGGEIKSNGGDSLLKWKAEFGSELESCVVLGATSFQKTAQKHSENNDNEQINRSESESGSESESFSDEDLKLRVIWTISCLIASSARHYLLQQVVSDHLMLRSVEITDRSKQGKLLMREKQIEELRMSLNSPEKLDSPLERTRVPNLRMKLWHVPVLELPESGSVMKGATLVVISPVDTPAARVGCKDELLLDGAFDGDEEEKALGEAVREMMMKKKMYTLEMNSF